LTTLADVELLSPNGLRPGALRLPEKTTLRDALSAVLAAGGAPLTVVDDHDTVVGIATLELIGGLFGPGASFDGASGQSGGDGE
jgi:hypothetical protein